MKKNPNPPFITRLHVILSACRYSQKKLSELTGISEVTISRWKNPENPPSEGSISKICRATGCSFEWLTTGKGDPFQEKTEAPENDITRINSDVPQQQTMEADLPMIRNYRELAQMDADTLGEIQTWINDMEQWRPGFTSWFRLEFQNRFPEFDDWKNRVTKKSTGTGD